MSRKSVLRLIRRTRLPNVYEDSPDLRTLGADDFAFRRGLRYRALLLRHAGPRPALRQELRH